MLKKVVIYTDGACLGNPGVGGYGAILIYRGVQKELSGGERDTTNNRMELTAIIRALESLKEVCDVTVHTDSKYVSDAVNLGWAASWRARGWRKADRSPALNADLWETLLPLIEKHRVSFEWVKGHDGNPLNERCDELAVAAAKALKQKLT